MLEKQACASGPLPSLGICYCLELLTSVHKEMKDVSRGKNNINYKSLLENFGAVFNQVICLF